MKVCNADALLHETEANTTWYLSQKELVLPVLPLVSSEGMGTDVGLWYIDCLQVLDGHSFVSWS